MSRAGSMEPTILPRLAYPWPVWIRAYPGGRFQLGQRLRQSRHNLGACPHFEAGSVEIAADRLIPPSQAFREKSLADGIERQPILRPGEAMPLIRVQYVRHRNLFLFHGLDDLVRLGLLDARIVGTLGDEQRPCNPIYIGER